MKLGYYECHITIRDTGAMQAIVEALGWKFSKIDGDPVLGGGVRAFATKHYRGDTDLLTVIAQTELAVFALRAQAVEVVRHKVEHVVFDSLVKEIPE